MFLFIKFGKRSDRWEKINLNSFSAGIETSPLKYLTDTLTDHRFLVDTGATISLFPHKSKNKPSSLQLTAANGQPISSWGDRWIPLQFGNRRFEWSFQLADVDQPLLGADFLKAFNLLVDVAAAQILDSSSLQVISSSVSPPANQSPFYTALINTPTQYRDILAGFPDVTADRPKPNSKPAHGVYHHIQTTGPPVYAKARRLDPDKLIEAKAEFDRMEAAGIVRRSDSAWASPLHMVRKADNSWRPCGDFRRLNTVTKPDRYPVPNMQDLTARLHGSTIFSKLDLKKGYYQVPVNQRDIKKTAVITPFGLYEFLQMPFGLTNAGQTFQRLMDRFGAGMDFVFIYLDDILIASKNESTHLQHVRTVLTRLQEFGLVLNLSKCHFGLKQVEFLGHKISATGAEPLIRHVSAIQEFSPPSDVKQLQRFLGMINFYRRFLPNIAQTLKPLTAALKGSTKHFKWSESMSAAFSAAKQALVSASTLIHPDPSAQLSLAVDASDSHIGAVLQQFQNGGWAPLSFFSKQLDSTQSKYSAFDRELLAAYMAIRHFRYMLEGRKFHVQTDHKPLIHALRRVSTPWSARQTRHLAYIAEYTSDIRHISGTDNVVADTLSRPNIPPLVNMNKASATIQLPQIHSTLPHIYSVTVPEPPPGVNYLQLANQQTICPSVLRLSASINLKVVLLPVQNVKLLCDVSTGTPRPLVPDTLRKDIFSALHGIAHPGIRATRRMISARFVWKNVNSDVKLWCENCRGCQRGKITRHIKADIQSIPIPDRRFSHIHVDLVGPLPLSNGYSHLFTIIDRSTRWAEAIPLSATSTRDCVEALLHQWVSRFGVPASLTSDRGPQFTSAVWAELCTRLGIQHSATTAYHPQANGMIERYHRQIKDALRARLAGVDWYHHLPWVLLGLRSAPKEDSAVSSAEMVYGSPLTLPGQFLDAPDPPKQEFIQDIRDKINQKPLPPTNHHNKLSLPSYIPNDLNKARFVFIRRDGHIPPLSPLYDGPYKVVERLEKSFRLQIGSTTDLVSIDRLKPYRTLLPVTPAQPAKRGRPSNQKHLLCKTISFHPTSQIIYQSRPPENPRLGRDPCRDHKLRICKRWKNKIRE